MSEYGTVGWQHAHPDIALQVAEFLHSRGIVADPHGEQRGGDTAVYLNELPNDPDKAVCVFGVTRSHDTSDSNPTIRFSLAHRGEPHNTLAPEHLAELTFLALHDQTDLQLTADQTLLVCRQVVSDPALRDGNNRWVRVDTYQALAAVPNTLS